MSDYTSKPSDTPPSPNCNVAKNRYLLGKLFLVVTPVDATSENEAIELYNKAQEEKAIASEGNVHATKKYFEPFLIQYGNKDHRAHLDAYTCLGLKLTRLDADGDVSRIIIPNDKNNPLDRPFGK